MSHATVTEPETWEIPSDPGTHIRAVRDRDGNYWQRDRSQVPGEPDAWACPHPAPIEQSKPVPFVARFPQLVYHRGPITDATHENDSDRRPTGERPAVRDVITTWGDDHEEDNR